MTQSELDKVLELHARYIRREVGGVCAILRGAILKGVNLEGADLKGANLIGADLRGANLIGADLRGANLKGADLRGVNLTGAYVGGANLKGADLTGVNLTGAYLEGADLKDANLKGADLKDANLEGAYLEGAYLEGANLKDALLPNFQIFPQEGPFYAYKRCAYFDLLKGQSIVVLTLYIPRSAKRTSSLIGRKCRASKAKVVKAESLTNETLSPDIVFHSSHDTKFEYKVGAWITPDSYNDDIRLECTNGIHFFMTKKEAAEY